MPIVTVLCCIVRMRQSFLMVNSHLTFPHCQMYKDMRLDQIKVVLESVRDYVTRESLHDVPIVRITVLYCLNYECIGA